MTENPRPRDGTTSAADPTASLPADDDWTPPGPVRGPRQVRPRPMPAGNGATADVVGALLFFMAILLVVCASYGLYH